jgi:prepilin-type N-terminal cleavage/methylation domain-containing protein
MNPRDRADGGFTLIELMIVVAIIGILAAIALPKFADLVRKSAEGTSKGNLGAVRSALAVYFGDMDGEYPGSLTGLTIGGKYLNALPSAKSPNYHTDASGEVDQIGNCDSLGTDWADASPGPMGAANPAGWAYCLDPVDPSYGVVLINCTHTDTKNVAWTTY